VTLVDLSQDVLDKSCARIGKSIERVAKVAHKEDKGAVKAFIDQSMSRLSTATSVDKALESADLVVEAVIEDIDLKQKLFKVCFFLST